MKKINIKKINIKKEDVIFIIVLAAVMILKVSMNSDNYKLIINGKEVDCNIIKKEGTTYIAIYEISKEVEK